MVQAAQYDLFISYADADRAWVEGYLLDSLKQAGVRYHSEAAFALGTVRILEFERAIQQSDRTLLVLSPAYLADGFNQFIDLLAQCYGFDLATWPVIPFILEPVKLPPRLNALVKLTATNLDEWEEAIRRLCAELKRPVPAFLPKPPCPYPGMIPFSQEDSDRFFGRDQEVQELLNRLYHYPFITVIGSSGSGKSSLVFAGFIPALRQSGLFGAGKWMVRTMRPGETPLIALEAALGSDPTNPVLAVTTALATQPDAQRLLLVIDQFEEVFTQAKQEAVPFQQALLSLVETPNCYVILTVRADFYPDLMESPLWQKIQSHRLEVLPLKGVGLREAIVRPAEAVDVFIESTLVERLLTDAGGEPGVLPLVQEAMKLLWEKIERRFLPFRAYEALVLNSTGYKNLDRWRSPRKGLQAAIANHADVAMSVLGEKQQQVARRIFLRLIHFGEGRADTRRQVSVEALRSSGEDSSLFNEILRHLVERRLLTLSGSERESSPNSVNRDEALHYLAEHSPLTLSGCKKESISQTSPSINVDIAHEALISGWAALRWWISQRRTAEQIRRRLVDRADEWERLGKGKGGLLDEVELAEAGRWLSSPDAEELGYDKTLLELIEASDRAIQEAKERAEAARQLELQLRQEKLEEERKARKAAQRTTIATAVTAVSVIALLVIGVFTREQWIQQRYSQITKDVSIGQARPELLPIAKEFRQKADSLKKTGKLTEALANYRVVLTFTNLLKEQAEQQSRAFPVDRATINEMARDAESAIAELIQAHQLLQLKGELKAKPPRFGKLKDSINLIDFENQFEKGALRTTYAILMRGYGAKADLNDDGLLTTSNEASQMPCQTLKEIEELWRQATQKRCGWYDKLTNSAYGNGSSPCSELGGQTLTEVVFNTPYNAAIERLNSCGIAPRPLNPNG